MCKETMDLIFMLTESIYMASVLVLMKFSCVYDIQLFYFYDDVFVRN